MATLIQETQWHGNPRPVVAFQWTSSVSPGEYTHDVSPEPYVTPGAAVTGFGAGVRSPYAEVEFSGVFKEGDQISINWITYDDTGAEIDTRGAAGTFSYDCSPETAAMLFSRFINGNVDTQAAQGDGVAKIYPVGIAVEVNVGQPVVTPAP